LLIGFELSLFDYKEPLDDGYTRLKKLTIIFFIRLLAKIFISLALMIIA